MKYWIIDENKKVIKTFHTDSFDKDMILRNYPSKYNVLKSYCCCFTEIFFNNYIGLCCKKHDNEVGQAGTYNPIVPHIVFFKCLRGQNIPLGWSMGTVFAGILGAWMKQPYLWYKIYKYRKLNA